jgi:hypothetical protein
MMSTVFTYQEACVIENGRVDDFDRSTGLYWCPAILLVFSHAYKETVSASGITASYQHPKKDAYHKSEMLSFHKALFLLLGK